MPYAARTVVASAARTTSGNSAAISVGGDTSFGTVEWVSLLVNVTASSGTTPTLDLTIEWSYDGSVWARNDTPDAFAQLTTTGTRVKRFASLAPIYRVVWTVAGTTPSFTFTVSELAINE